MILIYTQRDEGQMHTKWRRVEYSLGPVLVSVVLNVLESEQLRDG
jgi:hypothetical protein